MCTLISLLLCLSLAAVVVVARNQQDENVSGGAKTVREWLAEALLEIPSTTQIDLGESAMGGSSYLTIQNFFCDGLSLGYPILSQVQNEILQEVPSPQWISASISAEGIGTSCSASWVYKEKHFPHTTEEGAVDFTLSDSTLNFTLSVLLSQLFNSTRGYSYLPEAAAASYCNTEIEVSAMSFTGNSSIVDKLNAKETAIRFYLSEFLSEEACTGISQVISQNVSSVLLSLSQWMCKYSASPIIPVTVPDISFKAKDLRQLAVLNAVDYFLDDVLGVSGVNSIANTATNHTGTFSLDGLEQEKFHISSIGELELQLINVAFWGLNSWTTFDILEPVSDYLLESNLKFDSCGVNITISSNFSTFGFGNTFLFDPLWLYEEWIVSLSIEKSAIQSLLQLAVEPPSSSFTDAQCQDVQCLLSLIHWNSTSLANLSIDISQVHLQMKGITGSFEEDILAAIDDLLAVLLVPYTNALPAFIQGFAAGPLIRSVNDLLLYMPTSECPYIPDTRASFQKTSIPTIIACTFGIILAITGLAVVSYAISRRLNDRWDKSCSNLEEGIPLSAKTSKETYLCVFDERACLLLHPKLSVTTRFLVPVLILIAVSAFVVYDVGRDYGGRFSITTGNGREVEFTPIVSKHSKFWLPGAPLVSFMVSGAHVWTYLVQLFLLLLWFLPCQVFPAKFRRPAFIFLALTELCAFMGTFVEISLIVAGTFQYILPAHNDFSSPISLDLHLAPLPGMPALIVGVLFSVPVIVLAWYLNEMALNQEVKLNSERQTLASFTTRGLPSYAAVSVIIVVPACLIICAFWLSFAFFVQFFSFKLTGLLGWLEDSAGIVNYQEFSIFSLLQAFGESAPTEADVRIPQTAAFLVVLVAPIVSCISVLAAWVLPLTQKGAKITAVISFTAFSYSAAFIFSLATVVSVSGISKLAQGIVGEACAPINAILEEYMYEQLDGDATCIDIQSSVFLPNFFFVFGAAVCFTALCTGVLICMKKRLEYSPKSVTVN